MAEAIAFLSFSAQASISLVCLFAQASIAFFSFSTCVSIARRIETFRLRFMVDLEKPQVREGGSPDKSMASLGVNRNAFPMFAPA